MSQYFSFHPDLIVEATSVCDRSCAGCYAPNLLTGKSRAEVFRESPALFLQPDLLGAALAAFPDRSLSVISLRGGEPTRHPLIGQLAAACSRKAARVFVETHARWVIEDSDESRAILRELHACGAAVKISFDEMHGLKPEQLARIVEKLTECGVAYCIAITEPDNESFLRTREACPWVPDERVVFQKKATELSELIRPKAGVIGVNGVLQKTLTAKAGFAG